MRVGAIFAGIVGLVSASSVRSPRVSKGSARDEVSTGSGSDRVDRERGISPTVREGSELADY
jgi:hypothetical protein